MKSDFVRILIPKGSEVPPYNSLTIGDNSREKNANLQTLPSKTITVTRAKKESGLCWSNLVKGTLLLITTAILVRHEFQIKGQEEITENLVSALEQRIKILEIIEGERQTRDYVPNSDLRQKREANYRSSNSYRAEQVRNGRGGSEGGSYFQGEDDSMLGRVTLPPIKGYRFNEERFDGGSANDDDVDLDSASISAETERLSRQQHHSSTQDSYSRGGNTHRQSISTTTTQGRGQSGGGFDLHDNGEGDDDYEIGGEGGRAGVGGGRGGSGTGCTTSLCGGGSGYSGGTTYQRGGVHRTSVVTTTQQHTPVATYSQTVYPIQTGQVHQQSSGSGGSRQSSISTQSQYGSGSSTGSRASGRGHQSADYSEEGDELVIGSASGGQQYVPEIARVLQIPNNVFRTGGIDLGLGNTFTHSGNRCGNVTTTRTRTGSITSGGSHSGHGHTDTEPCPVAGSTSGVVGTGGGTAYNYTYVREVSRSSSSSHPDENITTTVREYGSRPDNRQMQNFTRTDVISEPYHPPLVVHVEPPTTQRSRYQTRQQSHSQTQTGRGESGGSGYRSSGSGSTFYFQGSQSQREVETHAQRYSTPPTTTTTTQRYHRQPYDERPSPTQGYRIPYVEPDEDSYEPTYPAPVYEPTYAAPTYAPPPVYEATYAPYSPPYVAPQITRQVTYKSSTCRGQQRPLAAHYVGDGAGMLTSADGIFKEWKSSEWMTASLYREDGHYASTSTNFVLSASTGSLSVKKAGLYFIYSQIHIKEGDSLNGFIVQINSVPFLQCSLTKTNSCYTAGLRFLEENDEILIKAVELTRVSSYSADKSFFGLMNIGTPCS